ncbi:putative ATPase subunit 9 [Leptomonas pyrrhocoris]|uniref:Putative ATPase subunit 9 n=1 Tax=Leptomonas pyrrhocoris TaxID=157538 RepID=A0A0N0DRJ3_LEPPY|nr:putative ATPase subunit 9 [Leptomonas pyrrhocoris]KPA74231.1 putative ATPase subunit 9 [Leptomonas pyrrhocoris]|eukprot:XP_015652670.1 putative ATPase subunit 9 [Leptomonas pyrrhocoris]
MGSSAKITRGGNKKRVNQGRVEAKMRAQGAKSHTTSVKESVEAKKLLKQRAQAIADELKAKARAGGAAGNASPSQARPSSSGGIVRMAPKPAAKPKPSTQSEE